MGCRAAVGLTSRNWQAFSKAVGPLPTPTSNAWEVHCSGVFLALAVLGLLRLAIRLGVQGSISCDVKLHFPDD